jgi:hypothetical protein
MYIEKLDDGSEGIINDDGVAIDLGTIELIFELYRQNPQFAKSWMQLAADYVFVGHEVGQA